MRSRFLGQAKKPNWIPGGVTALGSLVLTSCESPLLVRKTISIGFLCLHIESRCYPVGHGILPEFKGNLRGYDPPHIVGMSSPLLTTAEHIHATLSLIEIEEF